MQQDPINLNRKEEKQFLGSTARDYLVCLPHKHSTIRVFSPRNHSYFLKSAVTVGKELLDATEG